MQEKRMSECCINMRSYLVDNSGRTATHVSSSGTRIRSKKVSVRAGTYYGEGRIVLRSRAKAFKSFDSIKGISKSIKNENRIISERAVIAKEYNDFVREVLREIPNSLCEAFKYLCNLSELTDADIAAWSAVSEPTISRLKNKEDYKTDIKTLVKLCIGMQLPLDISLTLLNRADIDIVKSTSKENRAYFILLSCCNEMSIEDCEKLFYGMTGKHLIDK